MNLGQGITMQKVAGETVKPREFGFIKSATFSVGIYLVEWRRPTLIDGCMENRRFWRLGAMRVPLTVDSPSATRADREAALKSA